MKRKFIALAIARLHSVFFEPCTDQKGSLLFGGSIGYASNSQQDVDVLDNKTDRKGKVLVLSPSFAVAVADNLFVGADLNWEKRKNKTIYPSKIEREANYKTIGGGVLFRKYWARVNNLYIFGQGRVGFGNDSKMILPLMMPPTLLVIRKDIPLKLPYIPALRLR